MPKTKDNKRESKKAPLRTAKEKKEAKRAKQDKASKTLQSMILRSVLVS